MGQQERRWKQLHAALVECSPRCGVGADDFTWAMECVYSRAFSGPYSGMIRAYNLAECYCSRYHIHVISYCSAF